MMSLFDLLPIDCVTVSIVAIVIGYIYFTWTFDHWKKQKIPFEEPKLFFGNFKDVFFTRKTVGELMEELYRKFKGEPFVGFWRFRKPGLLVCDIECVKSILSKDFNYFQENGFLIDHDLDPLMSRNPFFQEGAKWKNTRSLITPNFTSGKLKLLFPLMEGVSGELINYLRRTASSCGPDGMEAKDLASKYTMEMVATCAFGINGKSFEDPNAELKRMTNKMMTPTFLRNIEIMLMNFLPFLGTLLKARFIPWEVDQYYRRIINDVVEHRLKNGVTRKDYLQFLISSREKQMEKLEAMSVEDMTGHAVTFLTDGYETSSLTLSFAMYELARNPDIQETLRRAVDDALAAADGQWSFELVNDLPYLDQVISETLRLHTPLMQMEKMCTRDCVLRAAAGQERLVKASTLVVIPVRGLHMDPAIYPDPDRFDPDRFAPDRRDAVPKFAYLPFGEGPRMCIGMRFALAQIKLALAQLVRHFEIKTTQRTANPYTQNPHWFLRSAKEGLWVAFAPRTPPS